MNSPAKQKEAQRSRKISFWIASLLLHLIFFLALNWNRAKRAHTQEATPVEISIYKALGEVPGEVSAKSSHGSYSPESKNHHKNKSKPIVVQNQLHLNDLFPGPWHSQNDKNLDQTNNDADDDSQDSATLSPFGRGQKELGLYNYIYRTLESHVIYPAELRTRGIQGNVTATVIFSPDGEYLRSASTFTTNNNYLKVLVLKTLREAFQDKLNQNFMKEHKRIEIRCHFEFAVTEHDDALLAGRRNYVAGNNLKYYRYFQDSKLSWSLGPLHGWGVFPALDLLWFAKLGKKAVDDPLFIYTQDPEW